MLRYFAALTIVLMLGMVVSRLLIMKRQGIAALKFGDTHKTDFLIPPFALFYFYIVFAAAFGLPTVGTKEIFHSGIAEWLGVQPSSLSFHLAQLTHAGLITQRRLSRHLIYSAEYGTMSELLAYLTENCCGRGEPCVPACDPIDAFATGETDEAPARARVR